MQLKRRLLLFSVNRKRFGGTGLRACRGACSERVEGMTLAPKTFILSKGRDPKGGAPLFPPELL